jgi:hypothetical protein
VRFHNPRCGDFPSDLDAKQDTKAVFRHNSARCYNLAPPQAGVTERSVPVSGGKRPGRLLGVDVH